MRVRRSRQFSRVLSVYERCFGLDAKNLEIFLDHTFVRQALTNHVNIAGSINNLVGRGFRLVTSSCVIAECEALGSLFFGAQNILKAYTVLKCRHEYNPSQGAAWCIRKRIRVARKKGKTCGRLKRGEKCFLFALASNDTELRELARTVPGMPILFIAQRCVNTEPIPKITQEIVDKMASTSLEISEFEIAELRQIKDKYGLQKKCVFKKRTLSGPNPLSCRKKAYAAVSRNPVSKTKNEPKRRRKKPHRSLHKTLSVRLELNRLYGTPICKSRLSEPPSVEGPSAKS